jgi:hypothetical protein
MIVHRAGGMLSNPSVLAQKCGPATFRAGRDGKRHTAKAAD